MIAAALALTLAQPSMPLVPLAGVSDEETSIRSALKTAVRGKRDVLFLQDRKLRWYRVALTSGCLRGTFHKRPDVAPATRTIWLDRGDLLAVEPGFTCRITSVRRSETPPQYDSDSVVTLD